MGKVYKNGIVSPKGFDMSAGEPVDQREVVESKNDLYTLLNTYLGIEVKVRSEQYRKYRLIKTPSADPTSWLDVDASNSVPGPPGPPGPQGADNNSYDFHQAQQLNQEFIDVTPKYKIDSSLNDSILGGVHSSIWVETVGRWFNFKRGLDAKIYVFNDVNDLSDVIIIDSQENRFISGIENAVYNESTGKIYFIYGDNTYSETNTLVKSIDVSTLVVETVIDYNTGINPGYPIIMSVGPHLYTAEGNYRFGLSKFDLNGNQVDRINNLISSGSVGAHSWVMERDRLYIGSSINFSNENWYVSVDLDPFQKREEFNYAIPDADLSKGTSSFTSQIAIVGQYIYTGTENFPINKMYRINKDDLSDYTVINVLKNDDTDSFYFLVELGGKVYYGGSNNMFGYWDVSTSENVLLENPFPYSMNQVAVNRDQLLFAGFQSYPVNGTGFFGNGRYFKALRSKKGGEFGDSYLYTDIIKFESNNCFSNTPTSPITSSTIDIDLTGAVNGGRCLAYYKGPVLTENSFNGANIISFTGNNVADELTFIYALVDTVNDSVHINIVGGHTGYLPAT